MTVKKYPNSGGHLLQQWNIKSNGKKASAKIQVLLKSTKTNSPTGNLGPPSLHPIGDAIMYTETSGNNYGPKVFCSIERTDVLHISNIKFCWNCFSTGCS